MKPVERFIITLRPEPPGRDHLDRDATYRLRGMLKVALRRFGLRCVSVEIRTIESSGPGIALDPTKEALSFQASAPNHSGDGRSPLYTNDPTKARDKYSTTMPTEET